MTDHASTRPPETLLTVRDLTVGFPGKPVLRHVHFTVKRGECVALVGANGSGKTTLLRTLLGILRPLGGEIRYADGSTAGTRPALGYVPQRDQLDAAFPLTVAETVRMGAYRRWRPLLPITQARAERVSAALATVGARGWERRSVGELSGGERQRVLIARALMTDPDLLVLDEPTTGIDLVSEEAISNEIRRCRARGLGVVMVSHDVAHLVQVATRALLIEHGRLSETTLEELLAPERVHALLHGEAPHG